MKNFAKLVLFFCFSFIVILLAASLIALLQEQTALAVLFPPGPSSSGGNLFIHLGNSIPAAFYLAILLGISYASRRNMIYPAALTIMLVLALILGSAAMFGIESLSQLGDFTVQSNPPADLVQPGLILNQSGGTRVVFLEDPLENGGARAVSIAGQALYYQGQGSTSTRIPLPFTEEKNSLLAGISGDFTQSFRAFNAWYKAGFLPYWLYTGSLAVFLLSLGCLVNISFWSLANLFLAALAFRGALALEAFLNQPDINALIGSFAGSIIPPPMINPLIFFTAGVLILLYSGLVYLARGRVAHG
ncbi:MAG: hypothetical protein LBB72_08690 [Spirochaetaceae bacterium]|nr:hypothetical protein [Spirochaetaceae bacterium]